MRLGGSRVHPGTLGCALGVVGFIQCRWVHWGTSWGSSGSSGFCWLHWGAHLGSSGSSGVAVLIGVRPGGRRVRPGSLGSLRCTLEVVRCRWVNWGAHWGSWGPSNVARTIELRPGGRRVSLGLLEYWCSPWGSSGSLGSLGCAMGVLGYVLDRRVHSVAPWESSGSSGISWLIGVRPRGRRCALAVVGFTAVAGCIGVRPEGLWFIRCRCVVWGAPSGLLGSLGSQDSLECAVGMVGFVQGRRVH